jgi:chorismate mutase
MKPIKVESEEIKRVICSGDAYIQVDNRKFLLFEVDQVKEPNGYEVTDPDEEKQLLNALREENPILDDDEINRLLGDQK